ncbi:hypothetical protein [Agathobaculum sp.]|uniref:hypothetical protein n=1 Tax=Agathobaculum sp. TaxID=2048138 RepID=UPI003AEF3D21
MINTMSEIVDSAAPANAQEEQNRSTPIFPSSMPFFYEDKPHKSKKGKKHKKSKHSKQSKKSHGNTGKSDVTASVMKQAMDMSYRCGMAEFKVDLLEKTMRMGVAIKRGTFNDCLVDTGLELLSDGDS